MRMIKTKISKLLILLVVSLIVGWCLDWKLSTVAWIRWARIILSTITYPSLCVYPSYLWGPLQVWHEIFDAYQRVLCYHCFRPFFPCWVLAYCKVHGALYGFLWGPKATPPGVGVWFGGGLEIPLLEKALLAFSKPLICGVIGDLNPPCTSFLLPRFSFKNNALHTASLRVGGFKVQILKWMTWFSLLVNWFNHVLFELNYPTCLNNSINLVSYLAIVLPPWVSLWNALTWCST